MDQERARSNDSSGRWSPNTDSGLLRVDEATCHETKAMTVRMGLWTRRTTEMFSMLSKLPVKQPNASIL